MNPPGTGTHAVDDHHVDPPIDTSLAHPARVYDYLLGGKDNWPADRDVGERIMGLVPSARDEALANRAFLRRSVRYAAERGVDQFLDIGTGIPTVGPTHATAHAIRPDARILYVDNDPIVLTHARALLVDDELTHVLRADVRQPETILDHPEIGRLDLSRPVALMFVGLLYFITEAQLNGLLERYAAALAPGSLLLITHVLDTPEVEAAKAIYKTTAPLVPRSRRGIEALFAGWDLVEPGVVPIHDWRPDGDGPRAGHLLGGVAVKP